MSDTTETATASSDVIAAEMARRQALSAMGITVYSSRFDFPGAAKAQRFAAPAPELNEPAVVSSFVEPRIETPSTPVPQVPKTITSGQLLVCRCHNRERLSLPLGRSRFLSHVVGLSGAISMA